MIYSMMLLCGIEMKTTAYRPANYRKNTISRKNAGNSSAQDELTRSLRRNAEPPKPKERRNIKKRGNGQNSYADSRPWLK